MGLLPLEFTDCLTDSPYFRENLHAYEKELDKTSQQIKGLIKEVKDLLNAAKTLSRAQRNLANTLSNFTFDCIGGSQTDDEIVIAGSLKEFGRLLLSIEDERDRMLERASATFIDPIEQFRQHHIGGAKEGKKKFDKETTRFCQSLERHLNLSTKKSENHLQEADASLEMEQRHFVQASLEYVLKLQEVQERKKFEFVETILSFMYGWLTFYHQGHEAACEFKSFMTDLQVRVQRTRENYKATQNEAENLMKKMLDASRKQTKPQDPGVLNKMYTRQGYLFYMEKKAFGTTWVKQFCQYQKENRRFTMIQYNQTVSKISSSETITLKECIRRMSDSIDKRFCFDIIPVEKPSIVYTFQAISDEDRKLWLDAMDGKDPVPSTGKNFISKQDECLLDDLGFAFVKKCIETIEVKGLDDQGLYRVSGVTSKVTSLLQTALDRKRTLNDATDQITFDINGEDWEIRTVTSALKNYFRNLSEPLMTFRLHVAFMSAAKQENRGLRIEHVHCLVHKLPKANFEMLHLLIKHLYKVSSNCEKNLMTVSNLGVCFGPTLLRPEEETVAAIMDIKFGNVLVEILIENCDKIFTTKPAPQKPVSISQNQQLNQSSEFSHGVQQNNQQVIYGRTGLQENLQDALNRDMHNKGQMLKSSSYDHVLNSYHQVGQYPPKNRATYMHSYPNTYQQSNNSHGLPSYPAAPIYSQQASLGSTNSPRSLRPVTVYNPWNSQNLGVSQQFQTLNAGDYLINKRSPTVSLDTDGCDSNSLQSQPINSSMSSPPYYLNFSGPIQSSQMASQSYASNSVSSFPPLGLTNASTITSQTGRRVRTLYTCVGENSTELSFEPNAVILNVRPSKEPGWLEGIYNGKTGLIPQNYVQYLD